MKKMSCYGIKLDTFPETFGSLYTSDKEEPNTVLKQRLEETGYLFFKNFFDKDKILNARKALITELSRMGALNDNYPQEDAHPNPNYILERIHPEMGKLPVIRDLIQKSELPDFFSKLLGGQSKALDHIWVRVISPTLCTAPHCDHVYMSRGTKNLFTTWIPMGDVPKDHGSLMVLEKSHRAEKLKKYQSLDIDDGHNRNKIRFKHGIFFRGMHYSKNAKKVQKDLKLPWLTSDFDAGDIIIFSTRLLHATLDNNLDQLRLSVDTRFQLASDPIDYRYVGDSPLLHQQGPRPLPLVLRKIFNRF